MKRISVISLALLAGCGSSSPTPTPAEDGGSDGTVSDANGSDGPVADSPGSDGSDGERALESRVWHADVFVLLPIRGGADADHGGRSREVRDVHAG